MKKNIIYGIHPVVEAIRSGQEIDKVLVRKSSKSTPPSDLMSVLREHSVPYQFVPVEKLNRVTTKNHQGVIAFLSIVEYHEITNLVRQLFDEGKNPLILLLDGITDVRNFGAIARTAECTGVNAIVIPAQGAAQINEDAMKTSAGALNTIPVSRVENLRDTVRFLKESGIRTIYASEKGEKLLYEEDLVVPVAIILGSEESGVSKPLASMCDAGARIPQEGSIGSLNVSVAAGMFLYEAVRQRKLST